MKNKTITTNSLFLIIPGIVLLLSIFLKLATGPYWLATNFDPAYQYFVNGVYILKGLVPNHSDHPGTPLQLLCYTIDWLFNMGRPLGDTVIRVLTAPEFYLRIVFVVLSLINFFTSFGLAVYVFRKTSDRLAAVLTQLPALTFLVLKSWETSEPILPVVANVSPEPMLIGVLNLFNICLLMSFFAKTPREELAAGLCWGLAAGLGAAVKITFLPILIVPLLILSWKNKILFVGVFAASFVVWTLPILSKYPIIWGWISGIITHKGEYGSEAGSGGKIFNLFLNGKDILWQQWVFSVFLLAASVLVCWKLARKKWDRTTSYLTAVLAGVYVQFSAVTQHPGAHYLLPGLGLFSAVLVFLYWQCIAPHALGRKMTFIFILIGTFLGVGQAMVYRSKLENFTKGILAFHDQVSNKYQNCIFIDYYRSSDQQAALFFGDGWNLSPHLGKELFQLYPDKYYFHVWGNKILNFNDRVWANDLLAQNQCVLFRGDGQFDFSNGPYEVRLLDKGNFESVSMLGATTEKQAAMLLAGSIHFFQDGDYAKALVLALQARKFRYQPDSSVESLIQLYKPYLQH